MRAALGPGCVKTLFYDRFRSVGGEPDFETIADFRRDNGAAIRAVCGQFVELCRRVKLFTRAIVAIDGSKFKAVNNRDKNFTVA